MILSDREIRAARSRGAVGITPEPEPAAWSSSAVDLRLAGPLLYWHIPDSDQAKVVFCPHDPSYDFAALTEKYGREVPLDESGHIVEPFSALRNSWGECNKQKHKIMKHKIINTKGKIMESKIIKPK